MLATGQPPGPDFVSPLEAQQHFAVGVEEIIAVGLAARTNHIFGHTRFLQYADRLMVEMGGTRQRIDLGLLLGDDHGHAAPRQQQGQRDAGRPAADDQDVAVMNRASWA